MDLEDIIDFFSVRLFHLINASNIPDPTVLNIMRVISVSVNVAVGHIWPFVVGIVHTLVPHAPSAWIVNHLQLIQRLTNARKQS